MDVRRRRRGLEIRVANRAIARFPEFEWGYFIEQTVGPVRDRTPDEWWLRAYESDEAAEVSGTAGPLGLGVDFFADDYWLAVPPEVRESIQEEAYEAAREVIVARLDEHVAQMRHALEGINEH